MAVASGRAFPTAVLVGSAVLWGLLWWPLKHFSAMGIQGPVLSLYAYGGLGVCGIPVLWIHRRATRAAWPLMLGIAVSGGWSNASFVTAIMTGDVVRVMLLFYLAPAWTVLGGWLFLGEALGPRRLGAVAMALVGAGLIIDVDAAAQGQVSRVDLLALGAGLAFAADNLCMRAAVGVPVLAKTAATFLGCGMMAGGALLLTGETLSGVSATTVLALVGFALGWLLLGSVTTAYGVTHLEAGQAGIIILLELVVAVLSTSALGVAHFTPREAIGGFLVVAAACLEVFAAPAKTLPPSAKAAPL